MIHSTRWRSSPPWLVPMLVLFLVLGHACEVPAYVGLASHATGDAHHSTDHESDENLSSCDAAVVAPSSTAYLQAGPSLAVASALPAAAELIRARLVTSSRADSRLRLSRPPLFLLHASLLI